MTRRTWHIDYFVAILMTGGFFVHLVNVSNYLDDGEARVGEVLTRLVDSCLTLIMIYCAFVLIFRWKDVFRAFSITSTARRIGYWLITFYIGASIPGHLLFLSTGNTAYFDIFPWWFSLIIMPVYVLMTAYFITLRPAAHSGEGPAESVGGVQ